jgi:hypothetical protein
LSEDLKRALEEDLNEFLKQVSSLIPDTLRAAFAQRSLALRSFVIIVDDRISTSLRTSKGGYSYPKAFLDALKELDSDLKDRIYDAFPRKEYIKPFIKIPKNLTLKGLLIMASEHDPKFLEDFYMGLLPNGKLGDSKLRNIVNLCPTMIVEQFVKELQELERTLNRANITL